MKPIALTLIFVPVPVLGQLMEKEKRSKGSLGSKEYEGKKSGK